MEKHIIEYNGVEYGIDEPNIEFWNKLTTFQEFYDKDEFNLLLISMATGLSIDDLKNAPWEQVYETAQYLANYFLNVGDKFYNEFEYDGIKYRFIDLENLTFGEFIDIDEFLNRPPAKKQSEMNLLMALLYRPVGEDGKIEPYDSSKLQSRSQKFKTLPVKYLKGSLRFFLRLESILSQNTHSFFHRMKFKLKWKIVTLLRVFGGGILRSYIYLMKILRK
jgi:hypothetical protein